MAATFYYLEAPDGLEVLNWFREQGEKLRELSVPEGILLYYSEAGELAVDQGGEVDVSRSPLISLMPPHVRRQVLWTVGEVHFLAKDKRLEPLRKRFVTWLRSHELVWDQKSDGDVSAHFLEGSVRNIAPQVYALRSGLEALKEGRFFVADSDNEAVLDRLCKTLRLQGIDCA